MTCAHCAHTVASYLKKEGLKQVSVSYANNEVIFEEVIPEKLEQIKKGISQLGYRVTSYADKETQPLLSLEYLLIICTVLTIPLLLHMIVDISLLHEAWLQWMLATPVLLLGWYYFGKSALGSLRARSPNMDVLILLGATAAYGYSLAGFLLYRGSHYLFFETSATIITLVLLGNLIEKKSVKKTTSAIDNLARLKPDKAQLVLEINGFELTDTVAVENIKPGDTIRVNEGDRIPLDGTIVSGHGFTDESALTGESTPVEKNVGDSVIAGAILTQGSLKIKVTADVSQSYISKLIQLIREAHHEKPHLQRFADTLSSIFVPLVIFISVVTFLCSHFIFNIPATQAFMNSIAVLVIACPCAMGLATPTAIMVGLGRVASKGILIKGAKTVELLARVNTIVFDKTGTLTTGNFQIGRIKIFSNDSEQIIKSIIYALEKHSSHPIARSIVAQLQGIDTFPMYQVEEVKGIGIKGTDRLGNIYWFGSHHILSQPDQGYDLYLTKNNQLIAALDIEDNVKVEAKQVIAALKKLNIQVIMLSGDSRRKCEQVGRKIGISQIYAEVKPDDKLKMITHLSIHSPTAMVGDGINDAPALSKATVGISLGNASEIAIDSAQVILLNSNLFALYEAVLISRYTFSTIKQNLYWALSYNFIAIPVAAAGYLNPMLAAFSMAFSDIVVIGNSLLLKWKKISD